MIEKEIKMLENECKHDYVYEPMDNWWICLNCNEVADSETVKEIKQWINNKGN